MSSPLTLTGFGGFDTETIINSLIQQASAPVRLLQSQQQDVQSKIASLQSLSANVLNLRAAADGLVDSTLFGSATASSSNSAAVSATAASGAPAGSYTVAVTTLARPETQISNTGYAATTSVVGTSGSLTINIGTSNNQPITINATNNTLSGLRDAINGANLGVTASIVNTGVGATPYKLVLTGNTSGQSNTISVTGNIDGQPYSFTVTQAAASASLTVNGIGITSNSNTITGAVPGLTLNLLQPNSSATVTVSAATDQIKTKISSLVTSFNALNSFFVTQSTVNKTTNRAGVLAGDFTFSSVRSSVRGSFSSTVSNGGFFSSLAALGLEFQNDGSLVINDATLSDALNNRLSDVQKFFQGTAANGFANTLQNTLKSLTDPVDGVLTLATTTLQGTVTNLQDSIDRLQARIALQRKSLQQQFQAAQEAIAQLQNQGGSLAGLTASLLSGTSSSA